MLVRMAVGSAFVLLARAAPAHDPAVSWAVARIKDGKIRIEATLAGETAMTLLGVPAGSAPIPPDATTIFEPINQAIQEGGLYEVFDGEARLKVRACSTRFDGDDAFYVALEFDAPNAAEVRFQATFLKGVPVEHRTSLLVFGAGRDAIGGGQPTREHPVVTVRNPALSRSNTE